MKPRIIIHLSCLFFLFAEATYAQQAPVSRLKAYASALNSLRELKPVEKVYLQTDKPYYNTGDTLRFKAYLLNGDYLTPSAISGMLYVELDNEQGKSAKRIMVPVETGLAWGDIALDTVEIPHGNYTLRAYTNWMRNFSEDYIFTKQIHVSKSNNNPLLVKANFVQAGNKMEGRLVFNYLDGRRLSFKDMELRVMNGRKNLSKDKLTTGPDGGLKINFDIPDAIGALSIQANTTGGGVLTIPVNINRKENTDVQFMPEGGQLVAGLNNKIGFKAIGEDGKSVAVSGKVLNSKGKQVAAFASAHGGMGSFEFTPTAGEIYLAKIDGIAKNYALPVVKSHGTALSVKPSGADSLQITISATPDAKGDYELIGHANGIVCFAQHITVDGSSRSTISNVVFPTGIVRFSLLNSNYQPLNERIVFVNHHDELRITVEPKSSTYTTRDSIALAIKATDKDGKPVQANFSLAVTDNGQVKQDSLGTNMLNYLLLTADLKGNIEDPDYYFTGDKAMDLDNLMLTQGWVVYDWQEAFHPKLPFVYKPEKEFLVSGKVTTAFGGAIERSKVMLLANNPFTIKDTLTDNTGRFVFKNLFPVDTAVFKLQALNKKGKDVNVKIEMDELTLPVFKPVASGSPWYLNTDTIILNNSRARVDEAKALSNFKGEGTVLKEVNIKAKKTIAGSKNLNGSGEADLIIDGEELKKAHGKTLLTLLQEKIKAFNEGPFTPPKREYPRSLVLSQYLRRDFPMLSLADLGKLETMVLSRRQIPWRQSYKINQQEVRFIIDGVDLDLYYNDMDEVVVKMPELRLITNDTKRIMFIRPFLEYLTADDIAGIEVMSTPKYANNYDVEFDKTRDRLGRPNAFAYVEITTYGKQGPFMQITPGTVLYRTLPFSLAKQFYSPKYTVANKSTAIGTDARSTIFWEPDVTTDKDGKAVVNFYSADKPGTYTIILEGTDFDGQIGSSKHQLKIK